MSNHYFFCNFAFKMKKSVIFGITVLAIVWIWLAWILLSQGGITLKNLMVLAITGIIIFVPLYRKYIAREGEDK